MDDASIDDGALARALPDTLSQRLTRLSRGRAHRGKPVVYWMRVAVRDHDNAALDAALHAASVLGSPVLVYHAVSERYPYASDRHHTFILEGARDVARALAARGISYALHVERPGSRGPVLRELARGAALLVTEHAPVPPLDAWTSRLAAALTQDGVPMWTLDASCIVPMPLVAERPSRAYAFRTASKAIARGVLGSEWPVAPAAITYDGKLGFDPVDALALGDIEISRLVAKCEIDHAIGPVRALRGGSIAGYARWNAFRESGLPRYARDRNDALIDGTSRLSPYLHYGHVSALRIAKEALQRIDNDASKFVDELLVWREVAWHFCARTPPEELHTLAALPDWARATLERHAGDPRAALSTESLESGRSGDALWDAAQRMLVAHGELHNNVRMTWGKAVAAWTATPESSRAALVELNHRYALDGRDPASYGGLYWCLGLFDHPHAPEVRVTGAIRPRPTAHHATRLDVTSYAAKASRPSRRAIRRVAVVGAGVAGLSCARALANHNVEVVVFDKGRSAGGRLATRRVDDASFDIGAQYFTARDPRFLRHVASWQHDGICARWLGRIVALDRTGAPPRNTEPVDRWVGTPTMSTLGRHLAQGLDVRVGHRVDRLSRVGGRWTLHGLIAPAGVTLSPTSEVGEVAVWEGYDAVAVCLPAEQARLLVAGVSESLSPALATLSMLPCIALAAAFPTDSPLCGVGFDGAFVGRGDDSEVLGWIARDSSKPGRAAGERWVLHGAPAWSRSRFTHAEGAIQGELLDAFTRAIGAPVPAPIRAHVQRWRFARPSAAAHEGVFFDEEARIACGGDFAHGGRVEGAFLSGAAAAGRILGLPEQEVTSLE